MGANKGHLAELMSLWCPHGVLVVSVWCPCGVLMVPGHTFVNELDHVLGIADEAERNKTFKQFQEWDANVHGAIQVRLRETSLSWPLTLLSRRQFYRAIVVSFR